MQNRIKIMFIIHSLNCMGGAEKILVRLANYFSKNNYFDVSIFILDDLVSLFKIDENIKIYYYDKSQVNSKISNLFHKIKSIKDCVKENKIDVMISFMAPMNIVSTLASILSHVPIIISEHSSYSQSLKSSNTLIFLRRVLYPFTDATVILTEEDRPKYHYVKNIYVIPNPLVLPNIHNSIQRKKIILGVGRLHRIKGFDILIKAFSKLEASDWKLVIAGEGEEEKNLERLIKNLDISHKVEILGLIDDVEYYYKQASIYVLSSRSEGFPGALCEAMGYGCASIAFDCPTGPKEIISHNIDGILVEAENFLALEKAIQDLINNSEKREYLSNNALKIKERLNIERISKKWINIIEREK